MPTPKDRPDHVAQESGLPATPRGPPAEPAPAPKPLRAAAPPHATPQTGRGGFQVRCVWPPPSERPPRCSGAPPRCRWPRCRPFASDFAERALGECGLDVHAAAGPDVQQLEAEGPGRPLPLSRPPPPPAGAPTSQQAVKRVGHAKVKREAPVKTKVLEPARESRGSHGSLGATSGSTEPREGAGPCGWRRRPRPRRSAGPREASPSAWPPLALAVLPNPAHGSGPFLPRPGLTRLLPADDFVSLSFGCVVRPLPSSLSSAGKGDRPPPPPQRLTP